MKQFISILIVIWVFLGISAIFVGIKMMGDTTIRPEGNIAGTVLLCSGVLLEALMMSTVSIIYFVTRKT